MKNVTLVWTGVVLVACLLLPAQLTASMLFEYKYNETGTTCENTGLATGAPLADWGTMYDHTGTFADRHTADGGGVSGLPGDRAFDNTPTVFGKVGGMQAHSGVQTSPAPYVPSTSVTISGWLKDIKYATSGAPTYIYFNETGSGPSTRTALLLHPWGTLQLVVSNGSNNISTQGAYNSIYEAPTGGMDNEWTFFAAVLDGTQPDAQKMAFYKGTKTTPVQLVNYNISTATSTENNKWFGVMDISAAYGRLSGSIAGIVDNFRIHDAAQGSSGALGLQELEALRLQDIPEPATLAVLAFGALVALVSRRRR